MSSTFKTQIHKPEQGREVLPHPFRKAPLKREGQEGEMFRLIDNRDVI